MNRWKRTAEALARLAEDQQGKPEGDVARQKLIQILDKHPEARSHPPIIAFMRREMTLREFHDIRAAGVDTDGAWTGVDWRDAIRKMTEDLRQRMATNLQKEMAEAMARRIDRVIIFGAGDRGTNTHY